MCSVSRHMVAEPWRTVSHQHLLHMPNGMSHLTLSAHDGADLCPPTLDGGFVNAAQGYGIPAVLLPQIKVAVGCGEHSLATRFMG